MKHVRKRLDVHETMLGGYVKELRKRSPALLRAFQSRRQLLIECRTHSLIVLKNFFALGPVARLIVGKIATHRIDAKGKQLVQSRGGRFKLAEFASKEIPVEGLEMAQVEDNPMSFRDGTFV